MIPWDSFETSGVTSIGLPVTRGKFTLLYIDYVLIDYFLPVLYAPELECSWGDTNLTL